MSNSYKIIDETNWKRALHCNIFRNSIEPSYCVTFELYITKFLSKLKEKNYLFTFSLIFLTTKCANEIEEFRYRFLDGKIVLYNKIILPFSVQVHHSFVDGLHIGKFAENLQNTLNN